MIKQFFLRTLSSLLLLLYFAHVGYSQILKPVKWTFNVNRINDCEAELIFKAKIDKGFHVYSQFLDRDDGPVATTFNFDKSNDSNFKEKF
jgi:hypothetical protein